MPFSTTARDQNQNATNVANSIARIFVGDPQADMEFRNQQIKNETEYARQKYLAEQTISEANRRALIDAQAAAQGGYQAQAYAGARSNNALAAGREQENAARVNLGNAFTNGVDLSNPAQAGAVVGNMLRGGLDPKFASAMAILPGQSDETLGRILTAGTGPLGKDEYVSIGDRNANRTFTTNNRVVQGDGSVVAPAVMSPGGGKIPKLDQSQMNSMLRSAISSRGAQIAPDALLAPYFSSQPELYSNLAQVAGQAWDQSGGNAGFVQDQISRYLGDANFEDFDDNPVSPTADLEAFIANMRGEGTRIPIPPELQMPRGGAPSIPPGAKAPLPNLQNVGNGGAPAGAWKVIGVQPGG